MFSIIGRLDKDAQLVEGFNADHIVSFKVGEEGKKEGKKDGEKEMTLTLNFSDGSKETFKGEEAKVLYDKFILRQSLLSVNAVQIGSANKMLNSMQVQVGVARKKAEKEAGEKAQIKEARGFRQMI